MGVNKHHLVQPLQWINMDWTDVQLLNKVVDGLSKLGYYVKATKHSYQDKRCLVGVYPLEDKNPLYSRDAELFTGTMEEIVCWMRGINHRNEYLSMLKATTEKRIKDLEEKYIKNRLQTAMLHKIKNPDKPIDKHTQDLIDLQNK